MIKHLMTALALVCGAAAVAQDFPTKPITLIVPNPPGGVVDTSARLLNEPLSRLIGQSVVIDNRAGGSGNVAYGAVARAKPDGYTLLISYSAYHVGNPSLTPNLPWDQKDLTPVALLTVATNMIAVHPSVPANNLKEFVSYLKANPGKLNYASQGNGSLSHIGTEMFKLVSEKMDVTPLATAYLGTRQLNLREVRNVKTPADLKGVKLRMPGSKEWLFLGEALGATATPLAFGEVYLGLKTGTIDGQDNPLPTVRAAKFYEVTKQLVLTNHLVDSIFIAISNKTWNALTPAQKQNVKAAAQAAAQFNNENRIKEEAQIVDFFKQQGLQVTTPDLEAFRKSVQDTYAKSDYAKVWPAGMLERINNTR